MKATRHSFSICRNQNERAPTNSSSDGTQRFNSDDRFLAFHRFLGFFRRFLGFFRRFLFFYKWLVAVLGCDWSTGQLLVGVKHGEGEREQVRGRYVKGHARCRRYAHVRAYLFLSCVHVPYMFSNTYIHIIHTESVPTLSLHREVLGAGDGGFGGRSGA